MSTSARILLRPLLWLLWLALLALLLPLLLVFVTPILLLVWIIGLIGMLISREMRDHLHVTWLGWLLMGVWWPLLLVTATIPLLALVIAGALHFDGYGIPALTQSLIHLHRELPHDLQQLLPRPELTLSDWGGFCVGVGVVGFSSNCVYAFMDVPWRLKQIRQVRTLPRSRARSAAIGLAEFEGTVRGAGETLQISKRGTLTAQPFYLEDETGRILVDPGDTAVRPRSQSGSSLQLNEIEEGLHDGDRVYVIGNVQTRETHAPGALDAELLVVKPLKQRLVSSPIGRLLFPERHQPADRDAPNIFIVDRGREHNVIQRLRIALLDFCFFTGLYLGCSLWLVQTGWQWMR